MSMLAGFVRGQSDNLPKIDAIAMFSFLGRHPDFTGAEIRGAKAQRSGRESYGDNAVGYVQVKRESHVCTVKAVVTPEHKTLKKGYEVTVICNEEDEEVLSAHCDSCVASLGGCKHAIAILAWLHRRSEEPSVTEVTCYWKKSKMSTIGKTLKYMKTKELIKGQVRQLSPKSGSFLSEVLNVSKATGRIDAVLTTYYKGFSPEEKLSIYQLILSFYQSQQNLTATASAFLQYCSTQMSDDACQKAANKTQTQDKSRLWHELRFGRITASRAYESAHCHTMNGSLVENIIGASSIKNTNAMKRGKKLENEVRSLVEKRIGVKIEACGFYTSSDCPVMGASPDGISEEHIFEIKCPSSEKTMNKYIYNGNMTEKYKAQMQLQMYFTKKQKGLFCVANEDFETSKDIFLLSECFNESYCKNLIEKCIEFWKIAIFPVLEHCK